MKKFLISALWAACLCSCSFLDENPRDQRPAAELSDSRTNIYLTTLGHIYARIGSDTEGKGIAGTYRGIYDLNTFTTDEAILPTRSGDWYDGGLWQRLYLHSWVPGEAPLMNAWKYLYEMIVSANEAAPLLRDYPDLLDEMRALRAFFYYYLLDMFGNVPIVTEPDVPVRETVQSPRAKVFEFVVRELEEAAESLPLAHSNLPGPYYGRITRPVVYILLEKLYLNAPVYCGLAYYDKVILYADRLKEAGYSLAGCYGDNFTVANEQSPENIFTIPMDKHLYAAQNQYLFRSRHYAHAAALGFTGENGSSATLEVLEANGYGSEIEDPRFNENYYTYGEVIEYMPRSIALDLSGKPDEKTAGARMRKYEIDFGAFKDGKLMDNDWVIFRYADALLMKAEALLRTGHADEALPIVNEIRERSGAAPLEQLDEKLLLRERLIEFAWEGLRRQDMIRFGIYTSSWSFRPSLPGELETGYTCLFPIPADALSMNPLLEQNDGYGE